MGGAFVCANQILSSTRMPHPGVQRSKPGWLSWSRRCSCLARESRISLSYSDVLSNCCELSFTVKVVVVVVALFLLFQLTLNPNDYVFWAGFRYVDLSSLRRLEFGFPSGTSGKEPTWQCRNHRRRGLDPWMGKIPWRQKWQPTPYSCLENPMDRGTWRATVYRVAKSDITEAT